ncbi:MAG: branched-chain amino acid ABC transporter permease [Deltaproteobacteria bacterium]|nr:MAG: branched-chain amino acid ABC transporter permease [Deltaproteobacteria bacterium]
MKIALAILAAAALGFPFVFRGPYPQHLAILVMLYALLGSAWNLLGGFAGQVSLGQAIFFGAGAYTSTLLAQHAGLSPWVGMIAGALVAGALALAIGYPCFRLSGHYFAIATIAIGEIAGIAVTNWDFGGGAALRSLRAARAGSRRDGLAARCAGRLLLACHPRGPGRCAQRGRPCHALQAARHLGLGCFHRHGRHLLRAVRAVHRSGIGAAPLAFDPDLPRRRPRRGGHGHRPPAGRPGAGPALGSDPGASRRKRPEPRPRGLRAPHHAHLGVRARRDCRHRAAPRSHCSLTGDPSGATRTPSRSRRSRTVRAMIGAPGVSPCRQSVCARTARRVPVEVIT